MSDISKCVRSLLPLLLLASALRPAETAKAPEIPAELRAEFWQATAQLAKLEARFSECQSAIREIPEVHKKLVAQRALTVAKIRKGAPAGAGWELDEENLVWRPAPPQPALAVSPTSK